MKINLNLRTEEKTEPEAFLESKLTHLNKHGNQLTRNCTFNYISLIYLALYLYI